MKSALAFKFIWEDDYQEKMITQNEKEGRTLPWLVARGA